MIFGTSMIFYRKCMILNDAISGHAFLFRPFFSPYIGRQNVQLSCPQNSMWYYSLLRSLSIHWETKRTVDLPPRLDVVSPLCNFYYIRFWPYVGRQNICLSCKPGLNVISLSVAYVFGPYLCRNKYTLAARSSGGIILNYICFFIIPKCSVELPPDLGIVSPGYTGNPYCYAYSNIWHSHVLIAMIYHIKGLTKMHHRASQVGFNAAILQLINCSV